MREIRQGKNGGTERRRLVGDSRQGKNGGTEGGGWCVRE